MSDDVVIPTYPKAVSDVEAYSWNYAGGPPGPFLGVGETISTSTWTVPAGLTQPQSDTHDGTSTTVWIAGGVAGTVYSVVNEIHTTLGRDRSWSFLLRVYDIATA